MPGYNAANCEKKLTEIQSKEDKEKCVDLNYMVFTYGKFHNNFVNQIIHVIFVPIIIYTYYVMLCYVCTWKFDNELPLYGDSISFGIVPSFILCTAYMMVDWKIGLGVLSWWGPFTVLGNADFKLNQDALYFGMTHFWFMVSLNAFAWIMQFIGHGIFEKRAPAIITNLKFGLLAPFFVTFETMNYLFGYHEG